MFAPPLPAHHPALAPHHLPLGIHPPNTPPSPQPHDFLPSPSPLHDDLARSASPATDPVQRTPSRASYEYAEATPMNAVTKHPKLRLQLAMGADAFEAGGNVHGRMELASLTGKGMRIGEIAVELEAAEELHSRDHSARQTFLYARTLFQGAHLPPSNAVIPQGPITTSSHTHSGTTVWWSARKGKTTFPFSFPVPVRAPSSVQFAGNASLRYVLKGTAQIWIASSSSSAQASPHDHQHQQRHLISVRAEVPVVERWPVTLARSLPSHPLFYEAIEAVADTRLFLGGNGAVWLEAGLLRSIFLSGSEMHLRLSVRNNTKRHVSGVKVSLARRLVFPVVRNDEREPGGPGSLLRPPAKTAALQASQQPMITEVVCEQAFKSAGGTASQAGVSYEFPPNEETVCVLPVRIPHDLRTVGVGIPCGPEHGGEDLAVASQQQQDQRYVPGSGWSGRSLLFEVQVLLRVSLPLGALAKDLTVELPIWVVHPRSVGAEGVKILMEAHDLTLQEPLHQAPGTQDAIAHHDPHRPKHRQSLDSHAQAYHNVPVPRPHSSAGHHHQAPPQHMANMSPYLAAGAPGGAIPPYQLPSSPSPHSLAPLEQYAIERGWSPAPLAHHGAQPVQLPSIAAVLPARPASAMDSYRPLPSPLSRTTPGPPPITPGMMVAIPQMPGSVPFAGVSPHGLTDQFGGGGGAGAAGFVFDPSAAQWRASQMLVSPDAMAHQAGTIQRSASAAPDVGSSHGRRESMPITTFANLGPAPAPAPAPARQQPSPGPQQMPALPMRRPSLANETSSEVRRAVSGPLPLPGSQITEPDGHSRFEPPKPAPSPGPHGRNGHAEPPKHKHVPTPPASMLSDSRSSTASKSSGAGGGGGPQVAAPTAQRAPPAPADVYAQLAMHTHSRMLSEVPEEGDEDYLEDEEHVHHGGHRGPAAQAHEATALPSTQEADPAQAPRGSDGGAGSTLGRAPSRLESQSPAPSRSPTMRDIAALEDMANSPISPDSRPPSTLPPKQTIVAAVAAVARGEEDRRATTPKANQKLQVEQVAVTVLANVGTKRSIKAPEAPTPEPARRALGRSSSSYSVSSQGAGLDALEARLSTVTAPIVAPSSRLTTAASKDDTATFVAPTSKLSQSKPASVVREKRLSLPTPAPSSRLTEQTTKEGSKQLPAIAPSISRLASTSPTPSGLPSSKHQVLTVQSSKAPSEAEVLLHQRRESLKKVDLAKPTVAPKASVVASDAAPKPPVDSQREAEQRALGKKAVDRVAGWLTEAASPPASSLAGVVEYANLGVGVAAGRGPAAQGGATASTKSDAEPQQLDSVFVRRVSAFDMIDAVNSPKTPSASVLMAYQSEAAAARGSKPLPPVGVPSSMSSSTSSSSTLAPRQSVSPSTLEPAAPTMAELIAASGIQPMEKGSGDGDSAMGSVNTFKPKARLTGKGGAPALDFSNVSATSGGVTEPKTALADALAPLPVAAAAPAPVRSKTAAAVAAFEIISGGPRPLRSGESSRDSELSLGMGAGAGGMGAVAGSQVKYTAPKIKPLKKPTSAGVFLNSSAPKAVFASPPLGSGASASPATSPTLASTVFPLKASAAAPKVVEADSRTGSGGGGGVEPSPSGLKVHPYSALALRPARRQSVDFKGRAAAFEGNASAQSSHLGTHDSNGTPSAIGPDASRHRSRASIDVVRPSAVAAMADAEAEAWGSSSPAPATYFAARASAGPQSAAPTAAATPTTRSTSRVSALGAAEHRGDAGSASWLDRFAPRASSSNGSATSSVATITAPAVVAPPSSSSSSSSSSKRHSSALGSVPVVESSSAAALAPAPVPSLLGVKKDMTTVDGRGTTKAIGANRLRELRSVWGS